MFNKRKLKKAFTLAEVLITTGIIGVIAALTIPTVMTDINNKVNGTLLQNTVAAIEQSAQDQLLLHKTRNLANTDFKDYESIKNVLNIKVTDESFRFMDNKYKTLNGGKGFDGWSSYSVKSVILSNGVQLFYSKVYNSDGVYPGQPWNTGTKDDLIGRFIVDLNTMSKAPNVIGKDLFSFYIRRDGHIVGGINDKSLSGCKGGGPNICYNAVEANNWIIPRY